MSNLVLKIRSGLTAVIVLSIAVVMAACANAVDDTDDLTVGNETGGNEVSGNVGGLEGFLGPEPDSLHGFSNSDTANPNALSNQLALPSFGDYFAIVHTNHGEIHIRLFPEHAPLAVRNFVTHSMDGYYDGVIFHRVWQNFMIQGGDPLGTGFGGQSIWGEGFGNEGSHNLVHARGALSTANTGMPNSNGSQFFIVDAPSGTPWLNFNHTVFGQVFYGMDVVDAIAAVEVIDPHGNPQNNIPPNHRPVEDVVIERIEILPWE